MREASRGIEVEFTAQQFLHSSTIQKNGDFADRGILMNQIQEFLVGKSEHIFVLLFTQKTKVNRFTDQPFSFLNNNNSKIVEFST